MGCPGIRGELTDLPCGVRSVELMNCPKVQGDISFFSGMDLTTLNLRWCTKIEGDLSCVENMASMTDVSWVDVSWVVCVKERSSV